MDTNEFLKNKKVILIGPSPSLEGSKKGEYIDSFDVVVRLNKSFPVEANEDIGTRTDIHYHCLHTNPACGGTIFYKELKEQNVILSAPYPKWVRPFYNDVSSFQKENQNWNIPFHMIDTHYYLEISKMLKTRPNSGTLAILDLLAYDVKELHITGFTWFRDGWRKSYKDYCDIFGTENGDNKREEDMSGMLKTHNQKPQEDLVREIYTNDDRVFIDDIMKEILEVK